MKGKVIVAIERAEQIISQIEHLIKVMPLDCLPDSFTFQVLKLEEYASLLKGCFDMGICADKIRDAVGGMNWGVLADLEGSTDAEKWALYNTIVNFNEIAKAGEPQQIEAQSGRKSLDEALAFVPEKHKGAAKSVFEGLLCDKWITPTAYGYKWREGVTVALVAYFADIANDKWELRNPDNGRSDWATFAKMFGMEAKQFKLWKSDQRNHTGEAPPKNADKIRKYFK